MPSDRVPWECTCCGCVLLILPQDSAEGYSCPQCAFVKCDEPGVFVACDCQIKWRKKAERLLRHLVYEANATHGAWKYDRDLVTMAERLLGEDKPDA